MSGAQRPRGADPTAEVAARLRARYPRSRVPRPVGVTLVGLAAAGAVAWLVWVAALNATPPVSAQVVAFTVESDRAIRITVRVDRRDPAVPAACRVVAQAVDFAPVAEERLTVPPSTERLVDSTVRLTTLRRATSARVVDCASG